MNTKWKVPGKFSDYLKQVTRDKDPSQRDVAKWTRAECEWGSSATIQRIADGSLPPTILAMSNVCQVLRSHGVAHIRPEDFEEYYVRQRWVDWKLRYYPGKVKAEDQPS